MVSARNRNRSRRPVPAWHEKFMSMLPAIVRYAKIAFRGLRPEAREECVQAVVCNACSAVARLAQLGKLDLAYASVLARFGVRQVRDGRKLGGRLNVCDISSEYCRRSKCLILERLDQFDETEDCWREILIEDKNATPAELAATRLDFPAWLDTLSRRHRNVAQFLARGHRTRDAARTFGVSQGRVSQLRRELKAAWEAFTGDDPTATVPA